MHDKLLFFEIRNAFFFLVAMLVTSSIAFFNGFYKLDKDEKMNIKLFYVLSIFFFYLFISLVVGPVIVKLLKNYISKMNIIGFTVSFNVSISLLIIICLAFFCYKIEPIISKQIIKRKTPHSSNISFDILIGIVSWFIAFPIISFISSLLDIFIFIIFKVQKLPDQLAIDFIKSTTAHPVYFILAIIMIVVIAPILEEFLFRGVLQNYLKKYFKRNLAIVITSIAFALFHFSITQKLANITILGSLFVLACFLSFLYERQKSLISPIFLHATFNAISILNLIFIKGI